jgi:hypothetical protein
MQAVMQAKLVKISSSAASKKNVQPKSTVRATTDKQTGRRFLDFLMAALSAPAA